MTAPEVTFFAPNQPTNIGDVVTNYLAQVGITDMHNLPEGEYSALVDHPETLNWWDQIRNFIGADIHHYSNITVNLDDYVGNDNIVDGITILDQEWNGETKYIDLMDAYTQTMTEITEPTFEFINYGQFDKKGNEVIHYQFTSTYDDNYYDEFATVQEKNGTTTIQTLIDFDPFFDGKFDKWQVMVDDTKIHTKDGELSDFQTIDVENLDLSKLTKYLRSQPENKVRDSINRDGGLEK